MDAVQTGCAFNYPLLEVDEFPVLPAGQRKNMPPVIVPMGTATPDRPWPAPVSSGYGGATPWPVTASAQMARAIQQLVAPSTQAQEPGPTRTGVKTYSPFG